MRIAPATKQGVEAFLRSAGESLSSFRYFASRDVDVIQQHDISVLGYLDDEPVAYGHIDEESGINWLGICVADRFVGQGLGTAVMRTLIDYCRRENKDTICLSVDPANIQAVRLYEKFGFYPIESPLPTLSSDCAYYGRRLPPCRIGMYMLTFEEEPLAVSNVKWNYELFDEISVAVGPISRYMAERGEPSIKDRTAEALSAIPDPLGKIRIIERERWADKNQMCESALEGMECSYVWQIDGDEFWPRTTFSQSLNVLKDRPDCVEVPHLILFGNNLIMESCGQRNFFVPPRVLKMGIGNIKHIPPCVEGVEMSRVRLKLPIWHLGWIGDERVQKKSLFHHRSWGKLASEFVEGDIVEPYSYPQTVLRHWDFAKLPSHVMDVIPKLK